MDRVAAKEVRLEFSHLLKVDLPTGEFRAPRMLPLVRGWISPK
jgi:hypothetical protein